MLGRYVEGSGINLGSAGHLGFIPPSSLYPAALGDYLATVINRYAGVYFAAPGAVQLENMVLRWMADFAGFPETASGDLTSGGSLANLIGVVTAREAHGLRARDYARAVVYLSAQTHHSVAKALRIAGVQECIQRQIPLDAAFHMQPQALAAAIAEDRRAGRVPWLIVGAAGTTDTGAVDPLEALAEIAGTQGCGCTWTGRTGRCLRCANREGLRCAGWSGRTRWCSTRTRGCLCRAGAAPCWCAMVRRCGRPMRTMRIICRTRRRWRRTRSRPRHTRRS